MANLKISQLPSSTGSTNDLLAVVNDGTTKKITINDIINLVPSLTSFNITAALSANTLTQITHNLNNPNIIVQTWDSAYDLVDMYVGKFSGDTDNIIVVETISADTYNINILGL